MPTLFQELSELGKAVHTKFTATITAFNMFSL